jgi:outer membrane receptor protein involved in Fe transport
MNGQVRQGVTVRRGLFAALFTTSMLTGLAPAAAQQQRPAAAATPAPFAVEEIVVTAQKRAENLQDVPLSIQAFGTEKLEELQVADFNDYARFLPSVAFQTVGPGFANVYMRGIASGENNNHSASLPSVGIYLDEQPITTITGALDVHIYDIARVEALAGPQGTLYGASSQSGTIRIITNKPDPSGFSASYDLEVNQIDHGGTGYVAEGYANAPLSENAAIRLVGWYKHDAGYIDNEPGTRTFPINMIDADGNVFDLPGDDITIDNAAVAEKNYNDVNTYGARAALRIDLDDSWTVTPAIMAQEQKSYGSFAYDPDVGDLDINRFSLERSHDRWYQAAATIEGSISNLDLVYAGAYLQRKVNGDSDYSDYSFFYDTCCGYSSYITDNAGNFIDPSQRIASVDRYTKQSHELRLSTPEASRLRLVAGLFYQRQTHNIEQNYIIDDLADATAVSTKPDNIWLTKQFRVDRDYAAFGELAFDITDKLTATGGLRLFKSDNSLEGFFGFGTGYSSSTGEAACFGPPQVKGSPCTNLDKRTKQTDVTHKLNLTYRIDDNKLVYATWSRGFRPGGINRRGTLDPYDADFVTNYELGWKTTLAENRVRFNGALYWLEWDDIQFSFLGANGLTEIRNAGKARVRGIETQLNWAVTDAFSLSAAAAYNDAELREDFCLIANPQFDCTTPGNETLAPAGTRLPITPRFNGNLVARYEMELGDWRTHLQGAVLTQTNRWVDLRLTERDIVGRMPGYTTADFSVGAERGDLSVELFVTNAFDSRGNVFRFAQCAETVCGDKTYIVPTQPRTVGLKFGQKF